ncbi:MAG TPA: 4Fe-4S dicluster domain-containing protein [Nitrospirae bacterium]|nr:4Fe-4S dicluster domain-containing protein [Nitrospirota bacterium]HDO22983.1 4Fe-4S dicluster domain-containing protein [Nitrospirota bacterium]HDZ87673.1 4Fe-4S dicluster domain-containing protein [Nitrospirota bacterium]
MSGVDVGKKRKGLLITPELCIGCRACQTACKQWNRLPGDRTVNSGTYENPPRLTPHLFNKIHFIEKNSNVGVDWLFVRRSCMHCGQAGCMDICPAPGAIFRTKEGAVMYDKKKCIGCKLCVAACPFDVPRYDENDKISKCTLCSDRISNGLSTACAKACTTGAIKFSSRDGLIAGAKTAGYKVYGENDLKGLGVTFAIRESPEAYNLPDPTYNASIAFWDGFLRPFSVIGLGAAAAAALLHYITIGPKEVEPEDESGKGGE